MNLTQEQRQELYDQYCYEMESETGFGSPSKWLKGPRNFAAFLASKRIGDDFDWALALIKITGSGGEK